MLKSTIPAAAAVLSMALAMLAPARAEYAAMSRHDAGQPPRLDRAEINALRSTRARHETPQRLRPSASMPGSRSSDTAWRAPRMAEEQRPQSSRSVVHVRLHATDPGTPRQAMSRSNPVDGVRAPVTPAPQRAAPPRAPRMKISEDTRMSRASFRDWLFGR